MDLKIIEESREKNLKELVQSALDTTDNGNFWLRTGMVIGRLFKQDELTDGEISASSKALAEVLYLASHDVDRDRGYFKAFTILEELLEKLTIDEK